MPLILNGTTGVSGVDGSAGTPSYQGGDTNTGIFYPAADTIAFAEGGAEIARFDSSGNFGIGTNSPSSKLEVSNSANSATVISVRNANGGASASARISFINSATVGEIGQTSTTYGGYGVLTADATYMYAGNNRPIQFATDNNYIAFGTGTGAPERMRITSTGRVGIGTSSPGGLLEVFGSPPSTSGSFGLAVSDGTRSGQLQITGSTYSYNGVGANEVLLYVGGGAMSLLADGQPIKFCAGSAERMRIGSDGNVAIGSTNALGRLYVQASTNSLSTAGGTARFDSSNSGDVGNTAVYISKFDNNTTTSQLFVRFLINNGNNGSGQINANGSGSAAFGTFSDSRLKENIVDLPQQLNNICSLRPVEFDYKDGSGHQIGFIAQEMQEVYPDVVGKDNNEMLTITGWDKTTARLVKAIQEQQAMIEELKQEVALLKAK